MSWKLLIYDRLLFTRCRDLASKVRGLSLEALQIKILISLSRSLCLNRCKPNIQSKCSQFVERPFLFLHHVSVRWSCLFFFFIRVNASRKTALHPALTSKSRMTYVNNGGICSQVCGDFAPWMRRGCRSVRCVIPVSLCVTTPIEMHEWWMSKPSKRTWLNARHLTDKEGNPPKRSGASTSPLCLHHTFFCFFFTPSRTKCCCLPLTENTQLETVPHVTVLFIRMPFNCFYCFLLPSLCIYCEAPQCEWSGDEKKAGGTHRGPTPGPWTAPIQHLLSVLVWLLQVSLVKTNTLFCCLHYEG